MGGVFSIADVLGSNEGIPYTVTITLADYQGYSGQINVMETAINMGTITLNEYTWPVSNLVATHSGDNALLSWDAAAAPTAFFWDFEDDDGDWTSVVMVIGNGVTPIPPVELLTGRRAQPVAYHLQPLTPVPVSGAPSSIQTIQMQVIGAISPIL